MPATKDQIIDALQHLDKTNDALWTDDGSPRMDALKASLGDDGLTRKQVNEALPGFSRNPPSAVDAEAAAQTVVTAPDPIEPDTEDTPITDVMAADLDLDDPTNDRPMSRDELRDLMKRRIDDAAAEIVSAQKDIRDANANLTRVQQRHARLIGDFNRRFPPMSAAQNIKAHLAAHQRLKEEEAGVTSQVDRAMGQSRKVGWNRPARPVGVQARSGT